MNRIWIIAILFWCNIFIAYGQASINGKVVDSSTSEPLPFVSILYQDNPPKGVLTDINGAFSLPFTKNIKSIQVYYLGYATRTINIDSISDDLHNVTVSLTPVTFELGEIVVSRDANPSHRIIKKVIENRYLNNPEKLSSYSCTLYNKLVLEPKIKQNAAAKDSLKFKKIIKTFKNSGILIIESVSNRFYLNPDRIVDTVVASRVSGFENPSFTFMGTWFQPFDFYDETISLVSVNYLNPISQNSYRNYSFALKDTVVNESDTTYIISFKPLPKKNFQGLKGVLYINTHNYSIQNVIAEPYNKGLMDFKIQQKYQLVNNEQWFPEQLLFEARLMNQPFLYYGKSYISDVKINSGMRPSDLGLEAVHIDKSAGGKDSIYWQQARTVPLTGEEQLTYHRIDSMGRKLDFDSKLRLIEDLAYGEIPAGAILGKTPLSIFNFFIDRFYYNNRAEGIHIGLGLKTNNKFSDFLSTGGYFGYGLNDRLWKFGADLDFTLSNEFETHFILNYQNTVMEPGSSGLDYNFYYDLNDFRRNYTITLNDKTVEYKAELSSRLFKYAVVNLSVKHQERTPLFDYLFSNELPEQSQTFSSVDLFIKYSYGERVERLFSRRISRGTGYPVVYMAYSKGLKGLFNGSVDFDRLEVGLYKSFMLRKVGESKIRIEAGYVSKDVPYFLLFSAEGNKGSSGIFAFRNTFQTMHRHEFLSDEYLNLFYSHNFGSIFFRTKKFSPQFSIIQNAGYGDLHHPEYHNLIEYKTKVKGFYESGIGLNNLIKINIENTVYLGFGAEAYYRWGAYSYSKAIDNSAFKMTFIATFN